MVSGDWGISSATPNLQKWQEGGSGRLQAGQHHICPWKDYGTASSEYPLQTIRREESHQEWLTRIHQSGKTEEGLMFIYIYIYIKKWEANG